MPAGRHRSPSRTVRPFLRLVGLCRAAPAHRPPLAARAGCRPPPGAHVPRRGHPKAPAPNRRRQRRLSSRCSRCAACTAGGSTRTSVRFPPPAICCAGALGGVPRPRAAVGRGAARAGTSHDAIGGSQPRGGAGVGGRIRGRGRARYAELIPRMDGEPGETHRLTLAGTAPAGGCSET